MTDGPSPARGGAASTAGWWTAGSLGVGAFVAVALLGQAIAFVVWLVSRRELSFPAFARLGWLYVGAIHHVPIVVDLPELDIGALTGGVVPGSTLPTTGSASGELGVALLGVTAFAAWLLYRAGRRAARAAGGGPVDRVLHGLAVAPAYALPIFALSWFVHLRADLSFGLLATARLDARLSPAPALVLPLLLAAVAGAAGGLASAEEDGSDVHVRRSVGILAGGWRMFLLGLGLSYAGLFVAGVVQPDGAAAPLTPSTAAYYRVVFARPGAGAVWLAHHLAIAPNEALWTLVPAMGGCDGASGSVSTSFLCYWRYPESVTLPVIGSAGSEGAPSSGSFGTAPLPYFLFLIVPAAAALLGGRHAADKALARTRREAGAVGAAAGIVFAALVAGVGFLASVTVTYAADLQGRTGAGSVRAGPYLVSGALLALGWGSVFGWLGGRFGVRPGSSAPTEGSVPVSD